MKYIDKILFFLLKNHKKESVTLLIFTLFAVFIEMLGISLVIPIISVLLDPEYIYKFQQTFQFKSLIRETDQNFLIKIFLLFVLCLYIFKSVFLIFFNFLQSQFICNIGINYNKKLFNTYLKQPYSFHIYSKSSSLMSNLITEVEQFSSSLYHFIILITEILISVGIISVLLIFTTINTIIIISILSLSIILVQLYSKKKLSIWGKERRYHQSQRIKFLQEGLQGIKSIKLSRGEEGFLTNYILHVKKYFLSLRNLRVLTAVPRIILEMSIVLSIILVVYLFFQMNSNKDIVLVLGVFGAAAVRIMPSLNRCIVGLQQLRFNRAAIDVIVREMKLEKRITKSSKATNYPFKKRIEFKRVFFKHKNNKKEILKNINLKIKKNSIVAFVGPTGSGKSTMVDILTGLLSPTSGFLQVDNQKLKEDKSQWFSKIGYVTQDIYLLDDTIRNNITLGVKPNQIDEIKLRKAVKNSALDIVIKKLPKKINTYVGERGIQLSGGQKQRIGIARALYNDPEILILDEATNALDTKTEKKIFNRILTKAFKKTVILLTHKTSNTKYAEKVYTINNGKMRLQGSK